MEAGLELLVIRHRPAWQEGRQRKGTHAFGGIAKKLPPSEAEKLAGRILRIKIFQVVLQLPIYT